MRKKDEPEEEEVLEVIEEKVPLKDAMPALNKNLHYKNVHFQRDHFQREELVKEIPKEISKVEVPKVEIPKVKVSQVEILEIPEPFPKSAGIAVRDALLKFPLDAQQVADIVRFTVSTLSPEDLKKQASEKAALEKAALEKAALEKALEKALQEKAKSKTHFSVRGLELPVEEDIIETESAGEKQGKINADTNPLVLQMVKDRK